MSKDESSANPYAPPASNYAPSAPAGAGRPGWYTFYCIMAIVLGSLGTANALMELPGVFFGQYVQAFQTPKDPNAPPNMQEMQEIQNEMNRELAEVNKRFFWPSLVQAIVLLGVGLALLIGGLRALSMSKNGAAFLASTFLFTSVFDVARLVLTVFEMMESSQIARKHLGPMMDTIPNRPPFLSADCISNSFAAMFGGFLCMVVVWTVFKLWLYLSGWLYFNKPHIQAMLKD
jgi:hypothetical protein